MEEKDLYLPVKKLFEGLDFEVYGEVKTVDVVAQREDLIVAIELKKDLNLHLISQGAYRQRLTNHVYIAVPTPSTRIQRGNPFKDKLYLLRRLGIGLIYVSTSKKPYHAKIILEPNLLDILASQRKNKRRRLALQKEISERHCDYNLGGTRGRIMTAYKEAALRILMVYSDQAIHTTKEIKEITGIKKATVILYKNYYGWYDRLGTGTYIINQSGLKALKDYKSFIDMFTKENDV